MELFLAIVLGIAFGFALNRVGATNPQYIINMLRLHDLHLAKVILLAIGISSLLLFTGLALGIRDADHLSVKESYWGVVIGGALLGLGFAIAGYCPGTGLCAAATGRIDALVFILGGLLGAFAFTVFYEDFEKTGIMTPIFGGKATLAETGIESYPALLTFTPEWLIAGVMALALIGLAAILPKNLIK
jgi:uncharacterized membrane protein YedE/YeeE